MDFQQFLASEVGSKENPQRFCEQPGASAHRAPLTHGFLTSSGV